MKLRPPIRVSLRTLGSAAAIAVFLASSGCSQPRSVGPAGSSGELPDQEVSDFAVAETNAGIVEWKLYARDAAIYNARNLIVARQIRIDFFDEDGTRSSELVAHEGDFNQRTRNMTARGDVVLQTTTGTRLSSQELRFLNGEQRVVVPDDQLVRIERDGNVLTGYGFESDPGLTHYEFKRQVQATIRSSRGVEGGGAR